MQRGPRLLLATWAAALVAVFASPIPSHSPTPGDDLTRRTVWVALAFYVAATWMMLGSAATDWRMETSRGRLTRWCWTLAWAAFLIHVGVAFHLYHHWSHAAAVEHVRERSGVGEGIFASYLFTTLWTADVAWWWLQPGGYARRPVWIDRALHGFMLAMIFFATVVYEAGFIRWAGIALCGALAVRWIASC